MWGKEDGVEYIGGDRECALLVRGMGGKEEKSEKPERVGDRGQGSGTGGGVFVCLLLGGGVIAYVCASVCV